MIAGGRAEGCDGGPRWPVTRPMNSGKGAKLDA